MSDKKQEVNIDGDLSGNLNVAGRDVNIDQSTKSTHIEDHSKKTDIKVGNITNSTGVGIGENVQVTVNQGGGDTADFEKLFTDIYTRLDQLQWELQDLRDAKAEVEEIKLEAAKGEEADENFLERKFRTIARMGPDILDVVTASLAGPAAGIAKVVQLVAKKAREENGLEPVS